MTESEQRFRANSKRLADFKAEIFAVFKKYDCRFDKAVAYYSGDPENLSVQLGPVPNSPAFFNDISLEDLIEESGCPFSR